MPGPNQYSSRRAQRLGLPSPKQRRSAIPPSRSPSGPIDTGVRPRPRRCLAPGTDQPIEVAGPRLPGARPATLTGVNRPACEQSWGPQFSPFLRPARTARRTPIIPLPEEVECSSPRVGRKRNTCRPACGAAGVASSFRPPSDRRASDPTGQLRASRARGLRQRALR